jgi:hypothetical protein
VPLTVVPSGPLSLPFPSAAILLASSTNFRTLVGAGSAAAAFDLIHFPYVDLLNAPPAVPFALLADYDQLTQDQETTTHAESGELLLQFYALPNPALDDPRDIVLDFRNKLGAVLLDMENNARNSVGDGTTYWGMTKWRKHDTPQPVKTQDAGFNFLDGGGNPVDSFLFAGFVLSWNT